MRTERFYFETNVDGLDALLHGGIQIPKHIHKQNRGLLILLKGAPGSGKTTLACQFVCSMLLLNKDLKNELNELNEQLKDNRSCDNDNDFNRPPSINYYSLDQTDEDITRKIFKIMINSDKYSKLQEKTSKDFTYDEFNFYLKIGYWIDKILKLNPTIENDSVKLEIQVKDIDANPKEAGKPICFMISKLIDNLEEYFDGDKFKTDIFNQEIQQILKFAIQLNDNLIQKICESDVFFEINDKKKENFEILFYNSENNVYLEFQAIIKILYAYTNILREYGKFGESSAFPKIMEFIKLFEKPNIMDILGNFSKLLNPLTEKNELIENILVINQSLNIISSQNSTKNENYREPHGFPLSSALTMLNAIPEKEEKSFLTVVDGINSLSEEESSYFNFQNLAKYLRQNSTVSIIAYDPNSRDAEFIDYMSDMIIELRTAKTKGPIKYENFTISIPKSRYQNAIRGSQHQYKIRNYGLVVFPYLHYYSTTERAGIGEGTKPHLDVALERSNQSMNYNAFDINKVSVVKESSLIDKVLNGVFPSSITALIGPRHTSKTNLSMDYLKSKLNIAVVKETESRLLVSIIDNSQTIINERDCKRKSCENYKNGSQPCYEEIDGIYKPKKTKCFENIFLYHFQPLVITANEFLFQIDRRLQESALKNTPITRLAFFDFTQLEYRFPNIVEDPYFLPSFMDYLKSSRYTIEMHFENEEIKVLRKYNNNDFPQPKSDIKFQSMITMGQNAYMFLINKDRKSLEVAESKINQTKEKVNSLIINSKGKISFEKCIINDFLSLLSSKINEESEKNQVNQKGHYFLRIPFDSGYIKASYENNKLILIIEYRISSLFMVSGSANLTKPISVLSDNVIFLWRDKLKMNKSEKEISHNKNKNKLQSGKEMLCFYVDRSEGDIKVESNRLFAFSICKEKNKKSPLHDPQLEQKEIQKQKKDFSLLVDAETEIKKIISLQGVTRHLYDYDIKESRVNYE